MVAIQVEVIPAVLGFGFVQPKERHALVEVVLLGLFPDEVAGLLLGGVEVHGVAHEVHGNADAPVHADQQALLQHLRIVFAVLIHGGPDGNHQLDAHGFQLPHHALRVRPIVGIELPIALVGPMEEVHHDHGDGQLAALILPRHRQQFLLGAVAQLALPKALGKVRHFRHRSRGLGVRLLDLGGGVPGGDPIVQLGGALGLPGGQVLAKAHPAHARVVPQKAVAQGGQQEGHGGLGIALGQLQIAAL